MAQINTRIILRNDSSFNWLLNEDVVLMQGEFGVEFLPDNTCKIKIGDGVSAWKNLPYFGGEQLISDEKTIIINDKILSLKGFAEAENGSQLRKNANGELEWFVPSTEDIDNLKLAVDNLDKELSTTQTDLRTLEEIILPTGENAVSLPARVENLEQTVNGTGEGTVDAKIDEKLNDFATKISDDGTINTFKELIDYAATHGPEVAEIVGDIADLQELVGTESVESQINKAIADSGHIAKDEALAIFLAKNEAKATYERKKYEVLSVPTGTVVDYNDKEIRILCPSDTVWTKQNVGANGDPNMHYMTFKAYAPEGAVGFKEGMGVVEDKMYSFTDTAAGTDSFGRNYSVMWLALASYDANTDTWTYFGKNSTTQKYIGWTYIVEWYDANGTIIDSDIIRINLSNENCHYVVEPYYMGNTITGAVMGDSVLSIVNKQLQIPVGAGLKESNEISIGTDGSLGIKQMSWDKLVAGETELVLNGGSSIID